MFAINTRLFLSVDPLIVLEVVGVKVKFFVFYFLARNKLSQ